jgi:tetratricopeptide (TPR) repeat protein
VEDYPELQELLTRNKARLAKLPPQKPSEVFEAMYAEALQTRQETLALRLLRILNQRANRAVQTERFTAERVKVASPASKVWMARLLTGEDPERAMVILRDLVSGLPESAAAAEALNLLGKMESQRGDPAAAEVYHNRVLEEHFASAYARQSATLRADALQAAERFEEAVAAYALVLNQREWRGEAWAEATFKIGDCFAQMEDLPKAQGFYERTYLAFASYPDWSGRAVLASAELLEAMGDPESAQRTYQYFLDLPAAQASPYYDAIRRKKLTP